MITRKPYTQAKTKEISLQFVALSDKMLQNHFMSLFSNDMDRVYFKLEDNISFLFQMET